MHDGRSAVDTTLMQSPRGDAQTISDVLFENSSASGDRFEHLIARADNKFCRDRRRRRPQVGYEIGNREIGLVTYGGNDRNGGQCYRSGDGLFVEGPEIFE
jgi:hypothetical protein